MVALNLDPVYLIFLSALAFSLVLLFILIGYIWPHRSTTGATSLVMMIIALIFWSTGYLVEYLSTSLDGKLFAFNISYIGMVVLPVFTLIFASYFSDNAGWINRRRIAFLLIIPVITLILQWTKQYHSFMYYDVHLISDGSFLLVAKQYGFWFWVDWAYNYALVLTSMLILLYRLFKPPRLFFDQAVCLVIAAVVPIAANVIYVAHLLPGPRADWTPCAFTITAVALTFSITRRRFLEVAPVARESAIEMLSEGFLVLNDRERISDLNKTMADIIGVSSEKLLGQPLPDGILHQFKGNKHYDSNSETKIDITLKIAGKKRYYSVHLSPLSKNNTRKYGRIMVFHDMTERIHKEEAIKQIAYYDPLTGLANRTLFSNRAEMAIEECKRHKRKLAILIIDFDKFKEVNDTYGHSTGDQVLKGLSKRISSAVRKMDTVSRLGGDEFLVLMPEISGEGMVDRISKRIIDLVSSPYVYEGNEIAVALSIGMSVFPDDAGDIDTLIKFADVAMYTAKQKGENCYCRYNKAESSIKRDF